MLLPEGIKIANGGGVKIEKRVFPLIEAAPEELSVNREGDTMERQGKWHRRNQKEKGNLWKYQELLMGDMLNLQASIGRGGRDEGGKDKVGNIWEGIHLSKHIARKGLTLSIQSKEDMDKVKAISLTETSAIKLEIQSTIILVKKINQG